MTMVVWSEKDFENACCEFGNSHKRKFEVEWCTGGSYGNCFDNQLSSFSGEAPAELSSLDDFLEKYFPAITFMQFRKITGKIKSSDRTEGDYYGGSTNYVGKYISFDDLQQTLISMNLLEIKK